MDLNEILDGMASENCANSCGGPGYNNATNCGNSYDSCGQPVGVAGCNNYNYGNNNCCGGFSSIIWLLLLCCGGFGYGGGYGGCGGGCCCHDDCCCGSGYGGYGGFGNGCGPLIWIIVLATLCGGNGFGCGNNCGNNFLGNCGC